MVVSSLESNRVMELFLVEGFSDNRILSLAKQKSVSIKWVSNQELSKLSNNSVHQGVVAKIKQFEYSSVEEIIRLSNKKQFPLVIMLDEINDPHNLGAIIRTLDAFEGDGIIIKKHNQVGLTDIVAKTSTGAINYVKVAQVVNLTRAIEQFKEAGFWVVSTDGSAKNSMYDIDYKMKTLLIIGSEGFGISRLVNKNADFTVKIPINGHVNSLNASVAAAILIAHITHQKAS